MSRPSRARGLKRSRRFKQGGGVSSRPSRARGLKRVDIPPAASAHRRAPRGRVD